MMYPRLATFRQNLQAELNAGNPDRPLHRTGIPEHQYPASCINLRPTQGPGYDLRTDPGRISHGNDNERLCHGLFLSS